MNTVNINFVTLQKDFVLKIITRNDAIVLFHDMQTKTGRKLFAI